MEKLGRHAKLEYDFELGDSHKMIHLLAVQTHYLRQIRNFLFVTMIAALATMGLVIGLVAGGYGAQQSMTRMEGKMDDMAKPLNDMSSSGGKFAEDLKNKFPVNQPEITVKQILATIANGKSISDRANELVHNVDDASVEHVMTLAKSIDPAEVHALLGKTQEIMTSANTLLQTVDAQKVNAVLTTFGNVKIEEINTLLKKVTELHEIKVQL